MHCLGTIVNTNKYYIIQTIMKYYLKTVLKNQEILSITILASLTTFVKCLKRNPTTIRVHKPLLPFMQILQKKSESLKIRLMSTFKSLFSALFNFSINNILAEILACNNRRLPGSREILLCPLSCRRKCSDCFAG